MLFLRIVAISQLLMGWELVYAQAFTGAGDTLPPLHVSVWTSILRVPVAGWLAYGTDLGPAGIWWTISVTGVIGMGDNQVGSHSLAMDTHRGIFSACSHSSRSP